MNQGVQGAVNAHTAQADVKPLVVAAFQTMLKEYTAQGNRWKCKAYNSALNSLKDIPEITCLDDIKDAKGFGKSLTAHVDEILKTHKMEAAKESDFAKHVDTLMTVHGVGIQAARKFAKSGIHTVDQLRRAYMDSKVQLTDAQKLGLKYYDDMQLRIPFSEMQKHEKFIRDRMTGLSKTARVDIVGSYRRRCKDSGDIDMLITDATDNHLLFEQFVDYLEDCEYAFGELSRGEVKYNGFCRLPGYKRVRRIDILYTKPEEYPFALLYFTGSGDFNKEMRAYCLTKGLSLNQRNITKADTDQIAAGGFKTEKEIFDFLGLKYIEPENRVSGQVIPLPL